jgi:P27 family predicted phage terminase small subunit
LSTGRKRKPHDLKVIHGTSRPDRDNPNAPARSQGTPVAPDWLDELALAYFNQIVQALDEQGRASPHDQHTIMNAALALGEVHECSIMIADHGRTYETTNSQGGRMIRPRPEVAQRSDAMRRATSCLAELGLTPASVGKVSTGGNDNGNPFDAI